MSRYFSTPELLAPPVERAAFSDRQAYVCAELSRLAYFRFEGGHSLDDAIAAAREILEADERLPLLESRLRRLLKNSPGSAEGGETALREILTAAQFRLEGVLSRRTTQAFYCTRSVKTADGEKRLAYIVFRGTEPDRLDDIKTDLRASLKEHPIGAETIALHTGFLDAFHLVEGELRAWLERRQYDQLFLAGHSLGGALAIIATRLLAHDTTGACYTFGAPPVGAVEFQNLLKTPVYEIVNETDIVPRLPNPWMASGILFLYYVLRAALKPITASQAWLVKGNWDARLEAFIRAMTRYRHPGYVSYLVGSSSEARLRWNVDGFDRFKWWIHMRWKGGAAPLKKLVGDHAIDEYVEKLRVHGLRRNG